MRFAKAVVKYRIPILIIAIILMIPHDQHKNQLRYA